MIVREFSAGGVVLRRMRGRWFVAVIEPQVERRGKPVKSTARSQREQQPVRALPKGTIDAGEKPEQTALREVEEETGVRAEMISKLGDIKYVYVRNWGDHARVFKIVSFYLFLYRSGKLGDIAPEMRVEVQRAFWLSLDEAPAKLSYKGEREMAERALQYLAIHPELGSHATNTAPAQRWDGGLQSG